MRICITILLLSILGSCSIKPEPILYGRDACYSCKMIIVDPKYGAEVVTTKGKIYKFDDMNCLVNFLDTGTVPSEEIAYTMVIAFSTPEKLIPAASAFFLASNQLKSPMAGQVAAFGSQAKLEEYKNKMTGDVLTWEEVMLKFKN